MSEKKYRTLKLESDVYEALNQYRNFHQKTFSDSIWQLLSQPERPAKKAFGERVYPFHNLEVGESCVIPWLVDPSHQNKKINGRISAAIQNYSKRTGSRFRWDGNTQAGPSYTRIS